MQDAEARLLRARRAEETTQRRCAREPASLLLRLWVRLLKLRAPYRPLDIVIPIAAGQTLQSLPQWQVLSLPGHTPGSISLLLDGIAFTGDTLFRMSVGRTDLAYGDSGALLDSINKKLLTLADDTIIYPGHGESSTIGEERRNNPFLN